MSSTDLKTAITVLTFLGAVLAGVYAYRKQRLEEGAALRGDDELLLARYESAAGQLGDAAAAARLAGVYALARLADDWPAMRRTCIDVLCAYLRLPYANGTDSSAVEAERQVRLAILKQMRDHLRAGADPSWRHVNLSFEGADLRGGDLSKAHFEGAYVSFYDATFTGTFHLDDVYLGTGSVLDLRRSTVDPGGTVHFSGAQRAENSRLLKDAESWLGSFELPMVPLPTVADRQSPS